MTTPFSYTRASERTQASLSQSRRLPTAKERCQPVAALNVRLMRMRDLGVRRATRGVMLDEEGWLLIYAEGLTHRYRDDEPTIRKVLVYDARRAKVRATDEDIANAIECARRAYQACPLCSTYTTTMIGEMLGVTLKEATEGISHLGCCEETAAEREARRKAAKTRRNAARDRKSGRVSQQRQAPWLALGISRRAYFNLNKAGELPCTEIGARKPSTKRLHSFKNSAALDQHRKKLADDELGRRPRPTTNRRETLKTTARAKNP